MRKARLILLLLVFLFSSCGNDKFSIEDVGFTYLKDEKGLLYFLVYFQYPKPEQFEASITLKTKDDAYLWKSMCQDFAVYGKSYKVAGRFSLPERLRSADVDVEINYRNKTVSLEKKIQYPEDKYTKDDIELFSLELKKSTQVNYSIDYSSSFKQGDEFAYTYKANNFLSSANAITSRLQNIKVTSGTTHLHLVEKKSPGDIIYTRTVVLL